MNRLAERQSCPPPNNQNDLINNCPLSAITLINIIINLCSLTCDSSRAIGITATVIRVISDLF